MNPISHWNKFFPKDMLSESEKTHFISELSQCTGIKTKEKLNIVKGMSNFDRSQFEMLLQMFREDETDQRSHPDYETLQNIAMTEWSKLMTQLNKEDRTTPAHLFNQLTKSIIGQNHILKAFASLLIQHQKKHASKLYHLKNISIILMAGPTGSGKTALVRHGAKQIDVPFVHVDCSTMTSEGLVGFSPSDIAKEVLRAADYDEERAEKCIVFLDEFDKLLFHDSESSSLHQLLRIIEGHKMPISTKYSDHEEFSKNSTIDTSQMFFVLAGSFEHIMQEKRQVSSGFLAQSVKEETLTLDDLSHSGLPIELLGRLKRVFFMKSLDEKDFFHILSNSTESPIFQYTQTVKELYDVQVKVSRKVMQMIASDASHSPYGVRRLSQLTHQMFEEILFTAPDLESKEVRIDIEYYQNHIQGARNA